MTGRISFPVQLLTDIVGRYPSRPSHVVYSVLAKMLTVIDSQTRFLLAKLCVDGLPAPPTPVTAPILAPRLARGKISRLRVTACQIISTTTRLSCRGALRIFTGATANYQLTSVFPTPSPVTLAFRADYKQAFPSQPPRTSHDTEETRCFAKVIQYSTIHPSVPLRASESRRSMVSYITHVPPSIMMFLFSEGRTVPRFLARKQLPIGVASSLDRVRLQLHT